MVQVFPFVPCGRSTLSDNFQFSLRNSVIGGAVWCLHCAPLLDAVGWAGYRVVRQVHRWRHGAESRHFPRQRRPTVGCDTGGKGNGPSR